MRAGLQTRAADFTQAFDRELTQIYVAFHGRARNARTHTAQAVGVGVGEGAGCGDRAGFDQGRLPARGARRGRQRAAAIRSRAQERCEPREWPPHRSSDWRRRATPRRRRSGVAGVLPIFIADAVDAAASGADHPDAARQARSTGSRRAHWRSSRSREATARAFIVWLDAERLRQQLLEPLVAKYFGAGEESEYLVTIVQRERSVDDRLHVGEQRDRRRTTPRCRPACSICA